MFFLLFFFLIYVKRCKNLSAKYYQRNTTKKLMKDISFKEEKEKKSDNMVLNFTKISQKMKKRNWLVIEKKYRTRKSTLLQ